MSLNLIKIPDSEGYSYSPTGSKIANIRWNSSAVCDYTKSYLVANVSLSCNTTITLNPVLCFGSTDNSEEYKPACLFKTVKYKSEKLPGLESERRYNNVLVHNQDFYSESVEDVSKQANFGRGLSVRDPRSGTLRRSVFFNEATQENQAADVIIPFGDLVGQLADYDEFPSMLCGNQHLQLEIEDQRGIVGQKINSKSLVSANTTIGANVSLYERAFDRNTLYPDTNDSIPWYVGQAVTITSNIDNTTTTTVATTITALTANDGAILDYANTAVAATDASILITFDDDIIPPGQSGKPVVSLTIADTAATLKTFTINSLDLVICEKKRTVSEVDILLKNVEKFGLSWYDWTTETINMVANTQFEKYFDLPSMCNAVMLSLPADSTLYSDRNARTTWRYRLTIDDQETSDRDINTVSPDDSLYYHKLKQAVVRTGKDLRNLEVNLGTATKALANNINITNILESVPLKSAMQHLKVSMTASNNFNHNSHNVLYLFKQVLKTVKV